MDVAIYCRISEDREGAGLGVERQRTDCEALAKGRGWHVAGVYVDNDVSAYSGKVRPEYRRLLTDVRAGQLDVIIAWHTDRLHRSPRELEEFIDACEAHKVRVETVQAGELDLKTPSGRAIARTLGAWARYESEHKAERIRRKMTELAQRGLPHSGGLRCYGYSSDGLSVIASEAEVIREAARRVVLGESLRAICIDLNQRGIYTSRGNPWTTPRLRVILLAPRIAGLIDHHTAGVVRATWPAIITTSQRARIQAILTDPSRRTNPGAPRRFLLSGILRCGECGSRMVGNKARDDRPAVYRCAPRENRRCGRVVVVLHRVEPFIVGAVLDALDNAHIEPRAHSAVDEQLDNVAADRSQLQELASMYASREITAAEWLRARAEIEHRIAEATKLAGAITADNAVGHLIRSRGTLRDAWPSLGLEQQRMIITAVLDHVVVSRVRTGRQFDPRRLTPVWVR